MNITDNYNTKTLARELGISRSDLHETLRDNRVPMTYNLTNRHWVITRREDVATAISYYTN